MGGMFKCLIFTMLSLASFTAMSQPRVVVLENPKMTVFLPSVANGSAVIACPGGGYSHLARGHEGFDWAHFFNNLGFVYAVVEYSMPNGDRELPLGDVRSAYKIMSDSAEAWGVNRDRIGIMGSSAGGHLASSVATHPTAGCRPAFQILFYPVISLDNSITHKGTRKGFLGENPDDQLVAQWSSHNNVDRGTPPAFIVLSGDDKAVSPQNSILYFNALTKAGVPATLHIYPTGGHGWGYRPTFKYHDVMLNELAEWLKNLNNEK